MKKLLIILTLVFLSTLSFSQSNKIYRFDKPIKLANISLGSSKDSVLVINSQGFVKFLSKYSLLADFPFPFPTLAEVLRQGNVSANTPIIEVGVDKITYSQNAITYNNSSTGVSIPFSINENGIYYTGGNTAELTNTSYGRRALRAVGTGTYNTAFGVNALIVNTTGNNNTGLGAFTLFANTTGSENTAVGRTTMQNNTTGIRNVAIGSGAMTLSNSSENVAIGLAAMQNNTSGSRNTTVGYQAGGSLSTGSDNVIIGYSSSVSGGITTGSGNVIIAKNTNVVPNTGSNNTIIGSTSGLGTVSSHIYIADGLGNIGFKKDNLNQTTFPLLTTALINSGGAKSATTKEYVDSKKPYKVYTAILTQIGTNAPVATVLENNIGAIVLSRVSSGNYVGTLTGAFTIGKTFGIITPTSNNLLIFNGNITVNSFEILTGGFDDVLLKSSLEVRVYN